MFKNKHRSFPIVIILFVIAWFLTITHIVISWLYDKDNRDNIDKKIISNVEKCYQEWKSSKECIEIWYYDCLSIWYSKEECIKEYNLNK